MVEEEKKVGKEVSVYEVGKNYFIRTVTHADVGKLVLVTPTELVLENASWVADTGRFTGSLQDGFGSQSGSEIEPFPVGTQVIVGRGAIVDAVIYEHNLPTQQK